MKLSQLLSFFLPAGTLSRKGPSPISASSSPADTPADSSTLSAGELAKPLLTPLEAAAVVAPVAPPRKLKSGRVSTPSYVGSAQSGQIIP